MGAVPFDMAKAPAFQFYPGDFLTGTTLMTNAEVGLFIRLLCLQAEHGSVPDDVERICRVYGEEVRELWPVVRSKFNHGSTGSTMVNERMVKVLAARDAFRERQVAAGKASAQKRSLQVETETQPEINPGSNRGSTTVEPIEDRDRVSVSLQKERAKVHEAVLWPTFDDFWAAYDRKGNKKTSAAEWGRLPQKDREAAMAAIPAYNASKPDKQFRKDGERFLKHRVWEDEIITPTSNGHGQPSNQQGQLELAAIIARRYADE